MPQTCVRHALPTSRRCATIAPMGLVAARRPGGVRLPLGLRRPSPAAAGAFGVYLTIGFLLTRGLWRDPSGRVLENAQDTDLFEWWLAWGAHALKGLHDPLVTHAINAPDGVNAMANTSVLLLGSVTAPITWLWGPGVSFALLITLAPALTGIATYATLRRFDLVRRAAFTGGLLAALAPGLHSQANGHLQLAMAVLVPLLIGEVLALAAGRVRPRTGGIRLGLLAVAQLLIGEEWLAIAALTSVVLLVGLAIAYPDRARAAAAPLAHGLGVALAVALPLAAVPLAVQLAGPQHYGGSPFDTAKYTTDLKSFITPSKLLLFSSGSARAHAPGLSGGFTEQTAYLGRVLIAVCLGIAVLLRRDRRVWILLGTAFAMAILSLGAHLTIDGRRTATALPWNLLDGLPLLEQALAGRIALVVPLLLAGIVALAVQWALAPAPERQLPGGVVLGATTIALLSILPTALPTLPATPAPPGWSQLPREGSILTAPEISGGTTAPLRWDAADGVHHALVGNYAIVPDDRGHARLGPPPSLTFDALAGVANGHPPALTPSSRAALMDDLERLRVSAVIAPPDVHHDGYVSFLTDLLGPPAQGEPSPIWLLPS
jgi:hypothetical protein